MRTVEAILAEIHEYKTCSKQQLYRYFAAFHIEPIGARQRPQLYPNDTAQRILAKFGIAPEDPGIVTMDDLRAERAKARKARRAA